MNWLFKLGTIMAAFAAVATASVALMVTLAQSSPARLVTPAELRSERTASTEDIQPRAVEEAAPPEGVELRAERERKVPGTPETSPPPERRERSSEDRQQNPPRRPTEPLPSPEPAPVQESTPNGPSVSPGEPGSTSRPRRYASRREAAFTLTVEALGVYDVPVANAAGDAALDRGPIHLPDTQMPWDGGEQKNVYIAGHRLGYPGTDSRLLFYELDKLRAGDKVVLKGRGNVFKYRVSEILVVDPSDRWAKAPVRGRDMVSLQTCTPIPTFEKRLVVRADRI